MAVTFETSGPHDSGVLAQEAGALLEQVARQATHATGAAGSAIMACDPGRRDVLRVVAAEGVAVRLADRVLSGVHIAKRALSRGRPVVAGSGRFPVPVDLVKGSSAAILAAGPIKSDGGFWGVVALLGAEPLEADDDVVYSILEDLGDLTAAALRGAAGRQAAEDSLEAGVDALSTLLDLRDGYTGSHAHEVVELCSAVGERLGLSDPALRDLRIAGRLHDLGKIGIPDGVLHKPRPLDDDEWTLMRQHPVWGAAALESIPGFRVAARGVRGHHERWDGSGYPDGLRDAEIPLTSRIITACDAFNAMVSDRPYRKALDPGEARRRLRRGAGEQFDPNVVDAVLAVIDEQPV